mmetsp:Transcript_2209/g.4226  ORF Transcript_2209/g.4226 Transcript_2209/m.4226 type:complete len:275 (-) Transcript_2209:188-1012(-)
MEPLDAAMMVRLTAFVMLLFSVTSMARRRGLSSKYRRMLWSCAWVATTISIVVNVMSFSFIRRISLVQDIFFSLDRIASTLVMSTFANTISMCVPQLIADFWNFPAWKVLSIIGSESAIAISISYGADADWLHFVGVFIVVMLVQIPGYLTIFFFVWSYYATQRASPDYDPEQVAKKIRISLIMANALFAAMLVVAVVQVPVLGIKNVDPRELQMQLHATFPLPWQMFLIWFVESFGMQNYSQPQQPQASASSNHSMSQMPPSAQNVSDLDAIT